MAGHPPGSDPGTKQTLIGVNVAHAMQQFLVQQGCFNLRPAGMEQRGKLIPRDVEGLAPCSHETRRLSLFVRNPVEGHASEPARVDKTEFSS